MNAIGRATLCLSLLTAGVVEVTPDAVVTRAVRVEHDARKHAELLLPSVLAACADAGTTLCRLPPKSAGKSYPWGRGDDLRPRDHLR